MREEETRVREEEKRTKTTTVFHIENIQARVCYFFFRFFFFECLATCNGVPTLRSFSLGCYCIQKRTNEPSVHHSNAISPCKKIKHDRDSSPSLFVYRNLLFFFSYNSLPFFRYSGIFQVRLHAEIEHRDSID